MKICLVHEEYPTETHYSGIGTYQKNLAEALAKDGYDVTVIAKSLKEDNNYIENGVKIIRIFQEVFESQLETFSNYREKVSNKLRELQDNGEIDIIETPDNGANTILFEKHRKVPLVVKIHKPSFLFNKYYEQLEDETHQNILKWEKKIIESADKVISSTKLLKDEIINNFKVNEIDVIPNLLDNSNFFSTNEKRNKSILYCGDLEERKGIIEFAKNIEFILKEIGNNKIIFIGKDTNKNEKNISTIEYIKELVPKKYHKNLCFKGEINNVELQKYYNSSAIGVFPSLYANFSYAALESMACGLPFVGSQNSGMKELVDEKHYLANTENLGEKIISLYLNKEDQKRISLQNLETIENKFSYKVIIPKIIKVYKNTINNYSEKIITKLFTDHIEEEIEEVKRIESGITNFVYTVLTKEMKYIVKIYKKQINEKAIYELIEIADKNDIQIVKPLENKFYKIIKAPTCIYPYVDGKHCKKLTHEQIEKLLNFISLEKQSNFKGETLLEKVNFYYESLREMDTKKIHREYIDELLKKYMKLQNYNIFKEKDIVHGDLSPSNIVWDDSNNFTLLDFDEAIQFTKLYDLIVLAMNFSKDKSEIDIKIASKILKPFDDYTKIDIINVWNFYILKVILEKIYLYEIDKIDLLEESSKEDDWEDWYKILNSSIIEEIVNH